LKNKNIHKVLNKPLIQWTFEQAKASKMLDHIFTSTNDQSVIELADKFGIKTIIRPEHLCSDNSTSESALIHALEILKNTHFIYPDIIVFLQATSPLRLFDDIDNAITHFINMNVDSMFSATKIDDLTIWRNKNSNWESINFDYKNRLRRQQMSDNYIENGSIYIFKPEILKKCNNRLGGEMSIYKMHFWQTWEIDSIEEIDLIEYYLSKYELGGYGVI